MADTDAGGDEDGEDGERDDGDQRGDGGGVDDVHDGASLVVLVA